MQTAQVLEAINLVNWLVGVVVFLLSAICLIGGYFLKKIHDTVINDHERGTKDHVRVEKIYPMVFKHEDILTKLLTEHKMIQGDKSKI
jgi:hypothetical protein